MKFSVDLPRPLTVNDIKQTMQTVSSVSSFSQKKKSSDKIARDYITITEKIKCLSSTEFRSWEQPQTPSGLVAHSYICPLELLSDPGDEDKLVFLEPSSPLTWATPAE